MKSIIKLCPVCLSPVIGRTDKVYCSEKCKNAANYQAKACKTKMKARMIQALDKNYSILNIMMANGTTSIRKEALESLGFDFSVCTSIKKGRCGHTLTCCFDMQYVQTASKIFHLKKML